MTDFKPMLAKDGDPRDLSYPLFLQVKLDGIRACVRDCVVLSRRFKPIPNREIQKVLGRPEFEGFDGELIVGDPAAEGCMQATTSFVMAPNKTGAPWAFHVFDLWNMPGVPYKARLRAMQKAVEQTLWTDAPIFAVDTWECSQPSEVDAREAALLEQGHEGVILRDPAGLYKFGRSGKKGPLIKVKRFIDFEARVIGTYELMHNGNEAKTNALGRTERSTAKAGKTGLDTLGGLVLVALNGPHAGQEFRCGTGFTAEQRDSLWDFHTRSSEFPVIGRTAKIKSFPVGVKDAPRFPVFLGWRDLEIDG